MTLQERLAQNAERLAKAQQQVVYLMGQKALLEELLKDERPEAAPTPLRKKASGD